MVERRAVSEGPGRQRRFNCIGLESDCEVRQQTRWALRKRRDDCRVLQDEGPQGSNAAWPPYESSTSSQLRFVIIATSTRRYITAVLLGIISACWWNHNVDRIETRAGESGDLPSRTDRPAISEGATCHSAGGDLPSEAGRPAIQVADNRNEHERTTTNSDLEPSSEVVVVVDEKLDSVKAAWDKLLRSTPSHRRLESCERLWELAWLAEVLGEGDLIEDYTYSVKNTKIESTRDTLPESFEKHAKDTGRIGLPTCGPNVPQCRLCRLSRKASHTNDKPSP